METGTTTNTIVATAIIVGIRWNFCPCGKKLEVDWNNCPICGLTAGTIPGRRIAIRIVGGV